MTTGLLCYLFTYASSDDRVSSSDHMASDEKISKYIYQLLEATITCQGCGSFPAQYHSM
jgi:hypothetical protein